MKKITTDLSAMYGAAHEHGMRVVALTVTPWGGFHRYYDASRAATTSELNHWIVAKQHDANAIDHVVRRSYPSSPAGTRKSFCERYATPFHDGIHFGPEGHKILAEALYREAFADCR